METLRNEHYKETEWTIQDAPIPCLGGWTPRKFLQKVGTECFRDNINFNFWVEVTLKKVAKFDIAFIEDARFSNEYEVCDLVLELEREGVDYARNHPSAMPPDEKYIWKKVKLSKDIAYNALAESIYLKLFTNEEGTPDAIQHIQGNQGSL